VTSVRASRDSAQSTRTNAPSVALCAVIAALLGVFMLYGVGFAGSNALHNAAHDSPPFPDLSLSLTEPGTWP
jgi:cobalt transporter subunit CbtB